MFRQIKPLVFLVTICTFIVTLNSQANELIGQSLKQNCQSNQTINSQCQQYLMAVAKGILTTKEILAEQAQTNKQQSAYAQRAYQTRVWTLRASQNNSQNYQAQVCLPVQKSNDILSQQVVDAIANHQTIERDIYRQVYKTILTLYPC